MYKKTQVFMDSYKAYSGAFMGKPEIEKGNKIILPNSALIRLTSMHVMFPMFFRITAPKSHRRTFCGVLEFVAEEECCYLPGWMMRHLVLDEGDTAIITNMQLKKATEITIRPYETKFTLLANPKVVLEQSLTHYACLSKGDTIMIEYNGETFEFDIVDTKPETAVGIIDTDVKINFVEPRDYQEHMAKMAAKAPPAAPVQKEEKKEKVLIPGQKLDPTKSFPGKGYQIMGKVVSEDAVKAALKSSQVKEAQFDPRLNRLNYFSDKNQMGREEASKAFPGKGFTLAEENKKNTKK